MKKMARVFLVVVSLLTTAKAASAGAEGRRNTAAVLGALAGYHAIQGHEENALLFGLGSVIAYDRYYDAREREIRDHYYRRESYYYRDEYPRHHRYGYYSGYQCPHYFRHRPDTQLIIIVPRRHHEYYYFSNNW